MARVVFAPDSFKGSITADAAARALERGWRAADPHLDAVLLPMADGGEGTLDAFLTSIPGAERVRVGVTAPSGEGTVETSWVLLPASADSPGGIGVVEFASSAGIELLGDRRDPWGASSRGFGEAIAAALDHGVSRLVLGIGSSASTDGGAGMLAALGGRFVNALGQVVPRAGARDLHTIVRVELSGLRRVPPGGVSVLVDVDNPLCGPRGASHVFGPQKGLAANELGTVDRALAHYAEMLPADPARPGAGAAGGTGFALLAWGARLTPGAPEVARLIGLDEAVAAASAVVAGEGSYDGQSAGGKAPAFVAEIGRRRGTPTALAAGRVSADVDTSAFAAVASLSVLAGSSDTAMADPERWLERAGEDLARRLSSRSDDPAPPRGAEVTPRTVPR